MVIAELQHGEAPVDVVRDAAQRLERGEVLILPTDTIYGLHVHAGKASYVERLREIKGIESEDRPFTTLYSTVVDIGRWVVLPEGRDRRKVVDSWPGPVTWVLPANPNVPGHLLAEDGTLGIRVPRHPLLRAISASLDYLIVSTSANFHGQPPATSRANFPRELLELCDSAIFELEPLSGKASEVKRWTPAGPEIIRSRTEDKPVSAERVNILLVCSGNICRSPLAEVALATRLREIAPNRFVVRSAGTLANYGNRASLFAVEVMKERGFDLSGHLSRPVSRNLVEWADIILTMNPDNLGDLNAMYPEHSGKMYLFTTFPEAIEGDELGIEDPYGMNVEKYRQVADSILNHVDRIIPYLLQMISRNNDSGGEPDED